MKLNEVFELETPEHVASLATSGMLVSTDVNVWSATKQDRSISDGVCKDKRASDKAGRFVKNLLVNFPEHKAIGTYRSTIYNWQVRKTFQWSKGQNYIFATDFEEYMNEWNQHKREFNRLVEQFCQRYPSKVIAMENEESGQGEMFNVHDYPSVEEVRARFKCEVYVSEVPELDPRCQISHDLVHDLKDNFARQCSDRIDSMVQQQVDMLTTVMKSLSTTCGGTEEYKVKGITKTRNSPINSNTLEKAKDYCKRFRKYTLVDSEANTKLQSAIKLLDDTLNGVDIKTLRESDVVRDNVKSNIDDIISKFDF
tara:strand:+ start:1539 stop:2471 length:933 start_codon:yes stop_codon:yes gene_type:complete